MEAKKKPVLTIGMIVKNEEKILERTLRSFQPLRARVPCEIIIADTGSVDGTEAVARQYADEVFHFTWCDDFAAARNAVVDRAHGEWYWSVDADEPLAEDVEHLVRFFSSKQRNEYDTAKYLLRNFTNAADKEQYGEMHARRMFRMATGLRFVRPIHEVFPLLKHEQSYTFSALTALHYGYRYETVEQVEAKRARNVAMLEKQLAQEPDSLQSLCEMLDAAYPEEARGYVERALAILRKKNNSGNFLRVRALLCVLHHYLACDLYEQVLAIGQEFADAYEQMVMAIDVLPLLANSAKVLGRYECAREKAEEYFRYLAAYDAGRHSKEGTPVLSWHTPRRRAEMHVLLAGVLRELKQMEAAGQELAKVDVARAAPGAFRAGVTCFMRLARAGAQQADLAAFYAAVQALHESGETELQERYAIFANTVNAVALLPQQRENKPVLEALAALDADDDLLRFVRLVLREQEADFAQRLRDYLSSTERWSNAPAVLYSLALRYDVPLPEAAFALPIERADVLTGEMARYNGYVQNVLRFWQREATGDVSVGKAIFLFALLARALIALDTVLQAQEKELLVDAFTQAAGACLDSLYRPEALQEAVLPALPVVHRFGYWLRRAQTAAPQEYLTCLKQALAVMPAQKAAVQFLMDRFEECLAQEQTGQSAEQTEFAALAQSVKQQARQLAEQGMPQQARAVLDQLKALCPDDAEIDDLLLLLAKP